MPMTRRMVITACTIAAAGVSIVVPSYGLPNFVAGDERYLPNPNLPAISYAGARASLDAAVKLEIDKTQRDFAITFSEPQKDVIRARVWNAAQLVLNQHYRPKELD